MVTCGKINMSLSRAIGGLSTRVYLPRLVNPLIVRAAAATESLWWVPKTGVLGEMAVADLDRPRFYADRCP